MFGRNGDRYNAVKGKCLLTLVTNQEKWLTAIELADATGLNRASLFVLLKRWSRPDWHLVQRQMSNGFYRYHVSKRGVNYFFRWRELMPIKVWQFEIEQHQQAARIARAHVVEEDRVI